jgi:hypothetical protein
MIQKEGLILFPFTMLRKINYLYPVETIS